jgi:hypothetical protein
VALAAEVADAQDAGHGAFAGRQRGPDEQDLGIELDPPAQEECKRCESIAAKRADRSSMASLSENSARLLHRPLRGRSDDLPDPLSEWQTASLHHMAKGLPLATLLVSSRCILVSTALLEKEIR